MATMASCIDHTITSFIHAYIHNYRRHGYYGVSDWPHHHIIHTNIIMEDMALSTWFSLHRTYVMNGCIFYVLET